jgi:hypothetical protein
VSRAVAERGPRPLLTFRLDPVLWHDVRARLAHDGRTLSDVVNQGLEHYVELPDPNGSGAPDAAASRDLGATTTGDGAALHSTDGNGVQAADEPIPPSSAPADLALPDEIATLLRELRSSGNGKLLSATLAHLHDIGWPLRTLACALGVSRQAVQARVRQHVPAEVRLRVQRLGPPPRYPRQRQPMAPGVRRSPSTVQVDTELRHRARVKAWREGSSLTQVVERILRTYLHHHEAPPSELTTAEAAAAGEDSPKKSSRRARRLARDERGAANEP